MREKTFKPPNQKKVKLKPPKKNHLNKHLNMILIIKVFKFLLGLAGNQKEFQISLKETFFGLLMNKFKVLKNRCIQN